MSLTIYSTKIIIKKVNEDEKMLVYWVFDCINIFFRINEDYDYYA
jgi:hypothetical protein